MDSRPSSLVCPGCGKLISGYLTECNFCGLKNPAQKKQLLGLMGLGPLSLIRPIIGVSILLFGLSYLLPLLIPGMPRTGGSGFLEFLPAPSPYALALLGWADPQAVFSGQWHLLFTAIFLHGGFLHILFNLLWVRDLGAQAEALLGPRLMFLVFLVSGAFGNLVAVVWPLVPLSLGFEGRFAPVVGASGAVFGLMGVIMAYAPKRAGFYGFGLAKQMGRWAVALILLGFLMPGISNAAHIGGFVAGWVLGKLLPAGKTKPLLELAAWAGVGVGVYAFLLQGWNAYQFLA